jgi:hypothetical protein
MDLDWTWLGQTIFSNLFYDGLKHLLGWSVIGGIISAIWNRNKAWWKTILFGLLGAIISVFLIATVYGVYIFANMPNVYKPFRDIHSVYKTQLGQAKQEPEVVKEANYIMCEHAAVLWIDKLHYHFILHGDTWQKEPASQIPYDLKTYSLPNRNQQIQIVT